MDSLRKLEDTVTFFLLKVYLDRYKLLRIMSKRYTVEIHHQEANYVIEVSEDEKILESARRAGVELPLSCEAGVCTTCTAHILEGKVEQGLSLIHISEPTRPY